MDSGKVPDGPDSADSPEVPDSTDGENLERLRDLLADLGARLVNGGMIAWANPGDIDGVADEVFGVVREAGLLADGDPRYPVTMPADADALISLLWEVDEAAAIDLLTSLAGGTSRNRPTHRQRRRYPDDPRDIFQEMASLTGPGTRWWTNTDLTRWNPITQHTFDAIVVGAGDGIIVTVIATDGGT
jgi:hypothetical protein